MKLEKRILQFVVLIAGLVPVLAGGAGVLAGVHMIPATVSEPSLDSHYRYLSGLLLALGLGFWSAIPDIERRTERVRLLTAIVVVGGLARVFGLLGGETPGRAMQLAVVMELFVTPLVCLWQARIAAAQPERRRFKLPVVPVAPDRSELPASDPHPGQ